MNQLTGVVENDLIINFFLYRTGQVLEPNVAHLRGTKRFGVILVYSFFFSENTYEQIRQSN